MVFGYLGAVSVFGLANVLFCLDALNIFENDLWLHLALGTIAPLLARIGGRIIPAFTGNWFKAQGTRVSMPDMGIVDKVGIVLTVISALSWTFLPEQGVTGLLLIVAGSALLIRLSRWHGLKTLSDPFIACLHIVYGFLGFSLIVIELSIWFPDAVPASSGLHLLSAGTIGFFVIFGFIREIYGWAGVFCVFCAGLFIGRAGFWSADLLRFWFVGV